MVHDYDGQSAAHTVDHENDRLNAENDIDSNDIASQEKIDELQMMHVTSYSGLTYTEQPYQEPVIPDASITPSDETAVASTHSPSGKHVDFSLLKIDPGYIESFCRHYEGRGISHVDLKQLAVDGVYKALEKYNPSQSAFQTYATWWMKERITQKFKDMRADQAYILERTRGVPLGSMVEDNVSEVSVEHSYYYEDGSIDPELVELHSCFTEIPDDLDHIYLEHICRVSQEILDGATKMCNYHRMLSSKPQKKWKEADMLDRQENYQFLHAVVNAVLKHEDADIVLKRFGVECVSFSDIAVANGVSGEAVRCTFLSALKDLINKLRSPITKNLALNAFKNALNEAKKPILG